MNKVQHNRYIELCKKYYGDEEFMEWLSLAITKYHIELPARRAVDNGYSFIDKVLEDASNY